jgi:UDP-GlcNAc3NAcA epimerase
MKVATVLGARPQFVKASAVSRLLRESGRATEILVHTGQHHDAEMSDVFFRELELPAPDYHLGVSGGPHGEQTGRMLAAVEEVLLRERPDWVLVYGDTNSTLAGALAAAKLKIPVAHVEAGLRSFNRAMPEEINRVLTDHVAELFFAPTETALANLSREGIDGANVHLVGDVMYDVALLFEKKAARESRVLQECGLRPGGYVLATVHRPANTDDPERLRAIFDALEGVARALPVVVPLHPRTRNALAQAGLRPGQGDRLRLLPPVGYLDMATLESRAALIATDSGGVQKEAFFYRVPCITLREETEWVELVERGWNQLVSPTDAGAVRRAIEEGLSRPRPPHDPALYGGGQAGRRVRDVLCGLQDEKELP